MTPPPPPRPRTSRVALVATLAATLVTVLVVAAVVVVVRSDWRGPFSTAKSTQGRTTPAATSSSGLPTSLKVGWQRTGQDLRERVGSRGKSTLLRFAATKAFVAAIGTDRAIAFDLATGKKLWQWQAPDTGADAGICTHAATTDGLIVSFTVENPDAKHPSFENLCTGIAALGPDGKERWRVDLTEHLPGKLYQQVADTSPFSIPHVFTVVGDRLLVVENTRILSFATADGSLRWKAEEKAFGNARGDLCGFEDAFVSAGALVTGLRCASTSDDRAMVQVRSVADGSVRSTGDAYDVDDELIHTGRTSSVFATQNPDDVTAWDRLTFLDSKGKKVATHRIPEASVMPYRIRQGSGAVGYQVAGDTLVVFRHLAPPVAFRISTGKELWTAAGDSAKFAGGGLVVGSTILMVGLGDTLDTYDLATGRPTDSEPIAITRMTPDVPLVNLDSFTPFGDRIVGLGSLGVVVFTP